MLVVKNMEHVKILCIQSKTPDLKSVNFLPSFKLTKALTDLLYFLTFLVFLYIHALKSPTWKKNSLQFGEKAYPKHLKIAFLIIVDIVFKLCKLEHYSHFTSCV